MAILKKIDYHVPLWIWAGRIGSFLTIFSAIILAIIHHPEMKWLFTIWTLSNFLWLWYGIKLDSGSLVASQIVFLMIDIIGVTHYWIIGNYSWHQLFG